MYGYDKNVYAKHDAQIMENDRLKDLYKHIYLLKYQWIKLFK